MTTITVWLLVVLGGQGYHEYSATTVVGKFPTVQECERVENVLATSKGEAWRLNTRCIQATIVVTRSIDG